MIAERPKFHRRRVATMLKDGYDGKRPSVYDDMVSGTGGNYGTSKYSRYIWYVITRVVLMFLFPPSKVLLPAAPPYAPSLSLRPNGDS